MLVLLDREQHPCCIREKIGVREAVFFVQAVEDLDLKLKRPRVGRTPEQGVILRCAGVAEKCITHSGELKSPEHVAKLVLIAKILIPVGVKEEMWRSLARPPRAFEVAIEKAIAGQKNCRHTNA